VGRLAFCGWALPWATTEKKGEECLRDAEKMRNPAERIEMLGIARNCMALADHAGRSQVNSPETKMPAGNSDPQ
jgi:hypothetical protein